MKKVIIFFICLAIIQVTQAQDSLEFQFKGYLKNLQTVFFPGDHVVFLENLVHHRLDVTWNISGPVTLSGGMRNRIFSGNIKALNPNFGSQIQSASNDWLPLSILWFDKGHVAIQSTFDRLMFEWNPDKWNIRLGRQRINWGVNLAFNPNDIFNAYNLLDFDYEERPGVDAIRIQYYYGSFSGLDLVVKGGDSLRGSGLAMRWFFNTKGYDFQVISGYSNLDYSLGFGWAGFLGGAGWKGEFTSFIPAKPGDVNPAFSFSTGVDYTFGQGWFLHGAYLFSGQDEDANVNPFMRTGRLTARNLYPFEHNFLYQMSYQVSPVLSLSSALIYSIDEDHPLLISPSVRLNLSDNWDLDLVGQNMIFLKKNPGLTNVNLVFLRIKMSY